MFGGGSYQDIVDSYDSNLTRGTPSSLRRARSALAATTLGDYALFGGGKTDSYSGITSVDSYNSNLTRSNLTNLSDNDMYELAATTVGNYALFGGGYITSNVDTYTLVDKFN